MCPSVAHSVPVCLPARLSACLSAYVCLCLSVCLLCIFVLSLVLLRLSLVCLVHCSFFVCFLYLLQLCCVFFLCFCIFVYFSFSSFFDLFCCCCVFSVFYLTLTARNTVRGSLCKAKCGGHSSLWKAASKQVVQHCFQKLHRGNRLLTSGQPSTAGCSALLDGYVCGTV